MIEFKKIQIIEKIKPATVSFLLNYTDGELHELTEEFKLKLKKYASYRNDGSESEVFTEKTGTTTTINVLIHYPLAKWPDEIEKMNNLFRGYAISFMNYYYTNKPYSLFVKP
ncbi:MAG: hypothetical protein PQ975_07700 [Methanobacterium sp.]|jgi:hypothetical protein